MAKNIEKKFKPEDLHSESSVQMGGIIFEKKSSCCNAKIKYTGGGLIIPYCSKCNKTIIEERYS